MDQHPPLPGGTGIRGQGERGAIQEEVPQRGPGHHGQVGHRRMAIHPHPRPVHLDLHLPPLHRDEVLHSALQDRDGLDVGRLGKQVVGLH